MHTAWLGVVGLLLGAAAGPPRPEDLSTQAQQILRKHCFACHGQDPKQAQARLNVLDYRQLLERRAIVPHTPDASELIGFIEDGTMPPANRPSVPKEERAVLREWVRTGALPFADRHIGSAYVLDRIVQDVKKLPAADRPLVRYFSLNHLLADEETKKDLPRYQNALAAAVAALSRAKANQVRPVMIESTGTVYRIHLADLGWDKKPYDNSPLTLFDLVLLEYPYGMVDLSFPAFQELADQFLLP